MLFTCQSNCFGRWINNKNKCYILYLNIEHYNMSKIRERNYKSLIIFLLGDLKNYNAHTLYIKYYMQERKNFKNEYGIVSSFLEIDCKCQAVFSDLQFLPENHQIFPVFGSCHSLCVSSLDQGLL